ncbi:unnamed protein product [Meganyctiphanes norvegica]|uniref:Uncharacterized protein n=1 Tax=Meganyctiphanes norvegica TaxID=48144 RepID=A0AAV2SRI3_MEGNR
MVLERLNPMLLALLVGDGDTQSRLVLSWLPLVASPISWEMSLLVTVFGDFSGDCSSLEVSRSLVLLLLSRLSFTLACPLVLLTTDSVRTTESVRTFAAEALVLVEYSLSMMFMVPTVSGFMGVVTGGGDVHPPEWHLC